MGECTYRVKNLRTDKMLAHSVGWAATHFSRMKGLIGQASIAAGEGLYIPHCGSVHTFFMKFSIDVVFLVRENRVKKIVECLAPSRIAFGSIGTFGTLELASKNVRKTSCGIGDQLYFQKNDV